MAFGRQIKITAEFCFHGCDHRIVTLTWDSVVTTEDAWMNTLTVR